jgi:cytochrome c-type biogenesis protein CcsB
MNSSAILSVITFIYALAAILYIFAWIFKKETPGKWATWVVLAGFIGNIAGLFLRWKESYDIGFGHAPLSNLYESLTFFAAVIAVVHLWVERSYQNKAIGVFTTPLSFLAMAYASMNPNIPDRIQPLLPALKSNWLIAHVMTCFVGYAAFAVAFGVSLMYLIRGQRDDSKSGLLARLPSTVDLDDLTHKLIMFGLLFLSTGIITGAVWANSAWGRYWGWDPKETWSFITWLIYFALLHAWRLPRWRGNHTACMSIIGFLAVLFTYFGVNYLPGLHSYGSMGQ